MMPFPNPIKSLLLLPAIILSLTSSKINVSAQSGVTFEPLGQSGKFKVISNDTSIMVTFDNLYELDANGDKVGTSGNVKHSIQTFASQDFTFTDQEDGIYSNISVSSINFTSTVSDDVGIISVETYIFLEDGTVSTDSDESWNVTEGGFKFNIVLSDWNFCGDDGFECSQGQTDQVGDKIDVTIEIKGQDSDLPEDSNATDTEYDMGGNATMYLSTKVNVDGVWEEMEEGYPKLELQGGKQLFTFRFPRFETEAYYDPLFGWNSDGGEECCGGLLEIISPLLLRGTV